MDEVNDTLRAVIEEITSTQIDHISELASGALLPIILSKIDPVTFKSDDATLTHWNVVQDRLEQFLESKGIKDRGLELPIHDAEEADEDAIVATMLQILALYVTFNKPSWDAVMKGLDFPTFTHITKLLTDMVHSLNDFLEISQKMNRYGDQLKLGPLLSKLEQKEAEIAQKDEEIKRLKIELSKETAAKNELTTKLKDTLRDLQDIQDIKERALEDLINQQSGVNDEVLAEKLEKQLREYEKEVKELKQKLDAASTANMDKELEISKLHSQIGGLSANQTQNEELKQQLEYYEKSSKELRMQNEVMSSRINSFSNVDTHIKALNTKLKEEKENSIRLQSQLEAAQPLIDNLQKRIELLEAKKRFSVAGEGAVTEFSDLHSLELFKNLKFENQQYRKQIEELMAQNRNIQLKAFNEAITEKENEALRAQIDHFLSTNDIGALKASKSIRDDIANGLDLGEMNLHEGSADKRISSIDKLATASEFTIETGSRKGASGNFGEHAEVLYTTLMEFYRSELADQRKYVVQRNDRERNIMKQFMLTDMLQGE